MSWPASKPLLELSPKDKWLLEDAFTGVLVMGATGSGKTSGPMATVLSTLIRTGCGGLYICAKPTSADEFRRLVPSSRREDIVIFGDPKSSKERFNLLDYERRRQPDDDLYIKTVVALLNDLAEISMRAEGQEQRFFSDATSEFLDVLMRVMVADGFPLTIERLERLYLTTPHSRSDLDYDGKQGDDRHYLVKVMDFVKTEAKRTGASAAVIEKVQQYFEMRWTRLNPETRMGIFMTVGVTLARLTSEPIRSLFGSTTTITPQDIIDGKLVVIDMPPSHYRLEGRIAGVIWKLMTQLSILGRKELKEGISDEKIRPCFIGIDEAQLFMTPRSTRLMRDDDFVAQGRQARGVSVYAIHSVTSVKEALKGDENAAAVFLDNMRTRFVCATNDSATRRWLRDVVGEIVWNPDENLDKFVTNLRQGGERNGRLVEAVALSPRGKFSANDRPFWIARFPQTIETGAAGWAKTFFTQNVRVVV